MSWPSAAIIITTAIHFMRFQDALLLQKQQAEQRERQQEAQARLEEVARHVHAQFNYWCQFRDPFAESRRRILTLQQELAAAATGRSPSNASGTSLETGSSGGRSTGNRGGRVAIPLSSGHMSAEEQQLLSAAEMTVRHQDQVSDLNPTAFSLYRKLKYG